MNEKLCECSNENCGRCSADFVHVLIECRLALGRNDIGGGEYTNTLNAFPPCMSACYFYGRGVGRMNCGGGGH